MPGSLPGLDGLKVNFSLRIDSSVPRETTLHFPRSESGNVLWLCFVGLICCSTHESVLFLLSSKVVTHGNMQFGKGDREGGSRGEERGVK